MGGSSGDQYPERERAGSTLSAYLVTWRCYGTWLHGDPRGSVDRLHNAHDSPFLAENVEREARERQKLTARPVTLDAPARAVVDATIREVCDHRSWALFAHQARPSHVHVVVAAGVRPERIMTDLKAWCTRRLVEHGLAGKGDRIWSYHGSTVYLWDEVQIERACRYVLEGQDVPPR